MTTSSSSLLLAAKEQEQQQQGHHPALDFSNSLFNEETDELFARTPAYPVLPIPSASDSLQRLATRAPQFMRASTTTSAASTAAGGDSSGSSAAKNMMASMGFKEGQGLGSRGQGMADPLQLYSSTNRAGLGSDRFIQQKQHGTGEGSNVDAEEEEAINPYTLPPNFKPQRHELKDEWLEHSAVQSVNWLHSPHHHEDDDDDDEDGDSHSASYARLVTTQVGDQTVNEEDDVRNDLNQLTPYCSEKLVRDLMAAKSQFDNVPSNLFTSARARSNPYEKIGPSIFQNRAAVKMANLDKVCGLTRDLPTDSNGMIQFADICAGPGGFTEYMYYRFKDSGCKGWGFTLKGDLDFRLDRFNPESPHSNFETHYGRDNTGDLTKSDNIRSLVEVIDRGTDGQGVALVLADGGISVVGNENQQEYLTRQLVLSQILAGMMILRPGGTFVCKVFDLFTHFSIDLMYILYRSFRTFAIVKPLTSRPANSERYIVCKGFLQRKPPICDFLFDVNDRLTAATLAQQRQQLNGVHGNDDTDGDSSEATEKIVRLCDPEVIRQDTNFTDYISSMNMLLGKKQLDHLNMIRIFLEDSSLEINRHQYALARACLEEWNLPPDRERYPSHRGRRGRRGRGGYGRGGQVHFHHGNRGREGGGHGHGYGGRGMHPARAAQQDPYLRPQQFHHARQPATPVAYSPAPWDHRPATPGVMHHHHPDVYAQSPAPFHPQTPGLFPRSAPTRPASTTVDSSNYKKSKEEQEQEILGRHEGRGIKRRLPSSSHRHSTSASPSMESNDDSGIEILEKAYHGK